MVGQSLLKKPPQEKKDKMYKSFNKKNNHTRNGFKNSGFKSHYVNNKQSKLDSSLFIRKADDYTKSEFVPTINFSDFQIDEKIKRNISEHGYIAPTEIQEKAIPEILNGRDIIGIANTGTGKTAAFLITLINKSYKDRNQRVLIVVPTRELAVQITDEFYIFAKGTNLNAVAAIGGANIKKQIYGLRHNPHFVVGTPGRLKDLIERRTLNLLMFQNIVLDEVDRMVDIGFLNDIKIIVDLLPKVRQSLFFSATVDGKAKEILAQFVADPVTVRITQENIPVNIHQDIIKIVNKHTKPDVLKDLLRKPGFDKVLVFGRTKWGMEKLSKNLIESGFKAGAIHGNKSQNQRQAILQEFKENKIQVLVATDVASRGLDIQDVTHVINFDAPTDYDDYIHRIGRTGRANKAGIALTFVE
jgi:ATP-dependent RNA helicase RhlE